ncbi:MAG: hypothetical protein RIR16_217 [Actinomycetota bacterium]|jgi:hypothetical protein
MSELIGLANAFRHATDEQVADNCRIRGINPSFAKDFFDLAESFRKPQAIDSAISALTREQAASLFEAKNGAELPAEKLTDLERLFLVDASSGQLYESVTAAVENFDETATRTITVIADCPYSNAELLRDAAANLFETLLALDQIVQHLVEHSVREVGKNNIGLPEVKRLASQLNKSQEDAKIYYQIAIGIELATAEGGEWWPSPKAATWLKKSRPQKLDDLLQYFLKILKATSTNSKFELPTQTQLHQWLELTFPFTQNRAGQRINQICALAEKIGLSANGFITENFAALDSMPSSAIAERLDHTLPEVQEKFIVQADLSIITPGPLTQEVDQKLRAIAQIETLGYASSYRLSLLSITSALAAGFDSKSITEFLSKHSSSTVPQPVSYLIREAEEKFGQIKVSGNETTEISFASSAIAATVANDRELRPFAFELAGPARLRSRFHADIVFEGLRDAGFAAVRVSEQGLPITNTRPRISSRVGQSATSIELTIARLREADSKLGASSEGDDLLRQIQLAIKNKTQIRVGVQTSAGQKIEYRLDPKSVANGRFRGMDRQADIERTLPISSIRSISLC